MSVFTKIYDEPPVSEREILRYAGVRSEGCDLNGLLNSALDEARPVLSYKVAYSEVMISVSGDEVDFGFFRVRSKKLSKNLAGCRGAIIFAATVGVGIDRLIMKYSRTSPSRALMMQAIGAERIEALCDVFCQDASVGRTLRPRFSPGYADLPLDTQSEIFALLSPERKIGLSLNTSMLMSPTKSVTAFIGVE